MQWLEGLHPWFAAAPHANFLPIQKGFHSPSVPTYGVGHTWPTVRENCVYQWHWNCVNFNAMLASFAKYVKLPVECWQPLSALLQLHLHARLDTWLQWTGQIQLQGETIIISILGFGASYIRDFMAVTLCFLHCNHILPLWCFHPWGVPRLLPVYCHEVDVQCGRFHPM